MDVTFKYKQNSNYESKGESQIKGRETCSQESLIATAAGVFKGYRLSLSPMSYKKDREEPNDSSVVCSIANRGTFQVHPSPSQM
jgi:hypothetical protein